MSYCALSKAQEILDRAAEGGHFDECSTTGAMTAKAFQILGEEFDDVDFRVVSGRVVAEPGWAYCSTYRLGRVARWMPQEDAS